MNRKQYAEWEKRDRAKSPHAWAIHDHLMSQMDQRVRTRKANVLIIKMVLGLALIIAAIITTT